MSRRPSSSKTGKHSLHEPQPRKFRILASGTVFITHTLNVASHPSPSSVNRAHLALRTRGGPATQSLALLVALSPQTISPYLIASLGGDSEARSLRRELEMDGIDTRYCRVWPDAGVPCAWIIHAVDTHSKTVINHNPLPDVTHEEFLASLGPALLPESQSSPDIHSNPSPFDWIHFEGRSIKTTLNNMLALSHLAHSRAWRSRSVFSLDVGRKGRQGVEALIPFADVVFLSKSYALSQGSFPNPRAFLLSVSTLAAPHALLVAHWGSQGSGILSVPTKEYYQSSGWVDDADSESIRSKQDIVSVSSSAPLHPERSSRRHFANSSSSSSSSSSADTEKGNDGQDAAESEETEYEAAGSHDAFVAGMIYALSRKLLPGPPYTPPSAAEAEGNVFEEQLRARWRLDECLRFATELAGRKARRRNWEGLAQEMSQSGWLLGAE